MDMDVCHVIVTLPRYLQLFVKSVGLTDEKDKMLLSFLIICTLRKRFEKIEPEDCIFFATGGVSTGSELPPNPTNWFSDNLWIEMLNISNLKNFHVRVFWNSSSISLGDIFHA